MDYKKEIESLLEGLKAKGVSRAIIEEDLGYSENYIDQTLSKGGNKKFLQSLKRYVLQKAIPPEVPVNGLPLPGTITVQDHIR
jgi:hypothetical protein